MSVKEKKKKKKKASHFAKKTPIFNRIQVETL